MTYFFESDLIDLIISSSLSTKAVLFVLLALSIASWAVIFTKLHTFRRAESSNARFLSLFRGTHDLPEVYRMVRRSEESPLARIFSSACRRLDLDNALKGVEEPPFMEEAAITARIRTVERGLSGAIQEETSRLEGHLSFLATTGNVSPFIGLFGTVLGIMDSFQSIGKQGTANIAVVAPGVAEALLATAAGLLTAIPAVVAYNYCVRRVRRMNTHMESFSQDVITAVTRWLSREKVTR